MYEKHTHSLKFTKRLRNPMPGQGGKRRCGLATNLTFQPRLGRQKKRQLKGLRPIRRTLKSRNGDLVWRKGCQTETASVWKGADAVLAPEGRPRRRTGGPDRHKKFYDWPVENDGWKNRAPSCLEEHEKIIQHRTTMENSKEKRNPCTREKTCRAQKKITNNNPITGKKIREE